MKNDLRHILDRLIALASRADRVEIIAYAFFAYALFVIWTSFKYTVLEYDYYR